MLYKKETIESSSSSSILYKRPYWTQRATKSFHFFLFAIYKRPYWTQRATKSFHFFLFAIYKRPYWTQRATKSFHFFLFAIYKRPYWTQRATKSFHFFLFAASLNKSINSAVTPVFSKSLLTTVHHVVTGLPNKQLSKMGKSAN